MPVPIPSQVLTSPSGVGGVSGLCPDTPVPLCASSLTRSLLSPQVVYETG